MNAQRIFIRWLIFSLVLTALVFPQPVQAQQDDPNPPEQTVKLIFIHHSTGENWLRDDYGDLGRTLDANHYFVSDTNYGWGPDAIGDRTDIVNWPEWFGPQRSENVLRALYAESNQNSADVTRTLDDPGGENEIVVFKSCFPNSELEGDPADGPTPGEYQLSVGSAKYIYNQLLEYFATRPDKMFVLVTAPPVSDATHAANARALSTWLTTEWLKNYPGKNVFVFDFYNVLTGPNNHHRFSSGQIEYVNTRGGNTSYYPSGGGDDHPSAAGSRKATDEFVPLLNVFYHRWKAAGGAVTAAQPGVQQPTAAAVADSGSQSAGGAALPAGVIDGFDDDQIEYWSDADSSGSTLTCALDPQTAQQGSSLHLEFSLVAQGYASCGRGLEPVQDWSAGEGLALSVHSKHAGLKVGLIVYSDKTPFEVYFTTNAESVNGWAFYRFAWDEFSRAPWSTEGTLSAIDPRKMTDFGVTINSEQKVSGELWVDQLALIGRATASQTPTNAPTRPPAQPTRPQPVATQPQAQPPTQPAPAKGPGLCPSAGLFPLAALFWLGKRRRPAARS